MANVKPYYTTNQLINSIQNRIAFPLSQNTLTYNDVVQMMNEELQINAVPAIKELHEEYFVYKCPPTPLVNGISRYPIPNRAMGMSVRDINWSDTSGNFFKLTRIAPEEKSFFQQNVGSNQAIGKYYLEGNEIVITPQVLAGATGSLNFFIYLRPNYLVRDDRGSFIEAFQNKSTINNSSLSNGDTFTITTGNQTPSPVITILKAVSAAPTNSLEFQIGATSVNTASNLNNTINALALEGVSSAVSGADLTISYEDISSTFQSSSAGISVDNTYMYVKFDSNFKSSYTDPVTDITSSLYVANSKIDFLQTDPGHRTYTYDIKLREVLSGNVGKFKAEDLKTYLNNSSGGVKQFCPIKIGDYICLANECIIPQIPPELHSALAERTAARILSAIGDKEGYALSQAKIAELDKQQASLIGQRVESSVPKIFNQFSLLRLGKRGRRRL